MKRLEKTEHASAKSENGASLGERVRSLRLGEHNTSGGGNTPVALTLAWGLCAILLATSLAFGYRTYRITPAEGNSSLGVGQSASATATSGSPALASSDSKGSGSVVLESKGYVVPVHTILVSPKVSGILVWLDPALEEGNEFQEGELLAILEDVEYRADRDTCLANLQNLKAQFARTRRHHRDEEEPPLYAKVRELKANVIDMRDQATRTERLFNQRVVNEEELIHRRQTLHIAEHQLATRQAELDLLLAGAWKPDIDAAEALVARARAELDKAEWKLDNTFIYAPVTGTILTKKAERGNLVNPSAFSNGLSASLCDMADLCDLEIELEIQERDVSRVLRGMPCSVVPEAFQSYEPFLKRYPEGCPGYVSRLMPTANRAKGAIPVRVRVPVPREEAGVYLKPQMGVIVSFKKG